MPSWGSRQHNRAVSHPFPALFGSGSGRKKSSAANLDADDKYLAYAGYGDTGALKGPPAKRDDDTSSNCMTCDSRVKYPRALTAFRCPECLTVNDLVPVGHDKPDRAPNTYPAPANPPRLLPLSVDRTRAVVDRCLATYLRARCERQTRSSQDSCRHSARGSAERDGHGEARLAPAPAGRERASSASRPVISVSPPSTVEKPNEFELLMGRRTPLGGGSAATGPPPDILAPPPTLKHPPRPVTAPAPPSRRPPPPPVHPPSGHSPARHGPASPRGAPPLREPPLTPAEIAERRRHEQIKNIFRPLEDYIIASYGNFECLNTAFMTGRQRPLARTRSEGAVNRNPADPKPLPPLPSADTPPADLLPDSDPKMLLLGDVGENGSWWTGRPEKESAKQALPVRGKSAGDAKVLVNHRSPLINWTELQFWYDAVNGAGISWRDRLNELPDLDFPEALTREADEDIREARIHVQRTLLKVAENLLKRPGRPLRDPEDARFLLIILSNPLLHGTGPRSRAPSLRPPLPGCPRRGSGPNQPPTIIPGRPPGSGPPSPVRPGRSASAASRDPGQHSGIIKRIFGLLANLDDECHRYITTWFSRFSEEHFRRTVDLVGRFVTYRLTRQQGRKRSNSGNPTAGLIPEFGSHGATSAQLHAALGLSGHGSKKNDDGSREAPYSDDWQLKAAAKVMALLFAANNTYHNRKSEPVNHPPAVAGMPSAGLAAKERARAHGQLLPTSDFYNTLLDYHDLVIDFEAWESRRAKFSFCQYPFFLSIGAKIKIMEHDARRQMEDKAREAFFDSILSNKNLEQYFNLRVRRECLVDDSLRRISEVVGAGTEDIKKGLKVQFIGEEGIDAGGLRKEWFLLLVRELFDPMHGMFVYDEDSLFCYFNPNTFELSDQFFLVGAVLGLALYNSTILDVALPPFAFKKLLASAPVKNGVAPASRSTIHYTLEDLAEFRPSLARGLRQLLDFDGDVEATFCRDFVAEIERYGTVTQVPLCPGGENRAVTNKNRQEFVDLYVRYLLDAAVARQFDPFRRGFFTVCGGNALSLFRSEEIELLVRGSDEPLDVASVRAVAQYDGWKERDRKVERPGETVLALRWFWEFFETANPTDQRKILSFITGSDRIPAVGATSLVIKVTCLGEDCERFPVARTCFNMLQLYKYKSRQKLVEKLWRAVLESEGFGLK